VGARRILIAFTAFAAASAGGAALVDTAAFGQADPGAPSTAARPDAPIAWLIRVLDTGLDSALGAVVAATAPQSALPPKRISAEDRGAAAPARAPSVREPTDRDIASMPPASAGTNGSFHRPSATALQNASKTSVAQVTHTSPNHVAVMLGSSAVAPPSAPPAVKHAIDAANTLVGQPYVLGGGHASFYSHGYDCSGSVSFALAGAGFLQAPVTSGQLANWGAPGPGKWITVYANGSHTYAVIAGLRWDTVGDARGTGPQWHVALPYPDGFVARHPPGY
jgi:cell wall-associated NlpC family hydrolase